MLPINHTNSSLFPSLLLNDWPFERISNGGSNGKSTAQVLGADIAEYADSYLIKIDVPGILTDNIELTMEGNALSIKVERAQTATEEGMKFLHCGRWHGSSVKTLNLPEAASDEDVEATLKDGVLTIKVHKKPEAQSRKVQIKTLS